MKTLAEIRKTKSEKEDDLLSRPGVTGVDIGPKIVKGKETDETSIRVYVEKKKDVPAKEKIPATINGIKTDVIERRFVLHQRAVPVMELTPKADTGLYDPLVGGISIGPCKAVGGYVYVGTLGCLVKDRDTDEVLILSNYHVLAEKWAEGDNLCQPSRVDSGTCPANTIGSLLRSTLSEHVDGAVARITSRGQECNITEIGEVKGKTTATVGMAVRKRGRTTGLTYGKVESTDLSVNVPYDDGVHTLKNQISITVDTSQSTQFGNGGDSGSVVVDDNGKVIGLYFAGTEDGSFGVANPIDYVLNELNIKLCVKPEMKSIFDEKGNADTVKWWLHDKNFKEYIKELKEHAYDKPPYFENKLVEGPPWGRPPLFGPTGPAAGPSGTSLEQRLERLEALLSGGQPGAPHVEPQGTTVCADFSTAPVTTGPNPVSSSGATFEVFDYTDTAVAATRVDEWGGIRGLNANYRTRITFPPCNKVKLVVTHFNPAGATAYAFDTASNQVAVASTTPTQGVAQTLTLVGANITRVELKCPQNEVLIKKFCHCATFKKPEKLEGKEKLEPKELKEKPEPKELKEKPEPKELKEKPEPKELKEKPEPKELKEFHEPKQIMEPKQFMEPKQIGEHKHFAENGNPFSPWQPQQPGRFNEAAGGSSIEERLARLEAALGGQQHFIGSELRPDLSGGSLQNEPDINRKR